MAQRQAPDDLARLGRQPRRAPIGKLPEEKIDTSLVLRVRRPIAKSKRGAFDRMV
jgi:hypothetical protein